MVDTPLFTPDDVKCCRDEALMYADDNTDGSESERSVAFASLADRLQQWIDQQPLPTIDEMDLSEG